jgi:hypothetical protein
MRRPASRLAILAAALGAGLALVAPAVAPAQTGAGIDVHALFSGGRTAGFTVGTPLDVQYSDPSGQTREQQVCWSPAPIDQPACTPTGTGAPASAGTQKVTVQLTNGQSLSKSFQVGAAATQLGSGTSNAPPVPYTVTCATSLYANAGTSQVLHALAPGQQVAAYYKANGSTLQVYDYTTNTAGFAPSRCLTGPKQRAKTYWKTFRLRSNTTQTYKLSLPSGFKAVSVNASTPIAYQLYVGSARGSGVGNSITAKGGGVHKPFLGATVIADGIASNAVFVRIRTGSLERPLTLALSAYGTA